jgi:hypothetical protein
MAGGQPVQDLLRVAERGAQGVALSIGTGQLGERGQRPLGGELGRTGEVQRP